MTDPEEQPRQQKVASKELIAEKVTGTVKWFNVKCSYGFINRNDTKEDVFVHQSAIVKNNPRKYVRSVGDGESVEFDVVVGEKGHEAANVTGPGGRSVQGSIYAADRRPWRRRVRSFYLRSEENREADVSEGSERSRGRGRGRGRGRVLSRGAPYRGRMRGRRGRGYAPRSYDDYYRGGRGGFRGRGRGTQSRRAYDYEDEEDEEEESQPTTRGRRGQRRYFGRSFYGRGRGRGRGSYNRANEEGEAKDDEPQENREQENGGSNGRRYIRKKRPRSRRESQKVTNGEKASEYEEKHVEANMSENNSAEASEDVLHKQDGRSQPVENDIGESNC